MFCEKLQVSKKDIEYRWVLRMWIKINIYLYASTPLWWLNIIGYQIVKILLCYVKGEDTICNSDMIWTDPL